MKTSTTYLAIPKALRAYLVISTYAWMKIDGSARIMNLLDSWEVTGSSLQTLKNNPESKSIIIQGMKAIVTTTLPLLI